MHILLTSPCQSAVAHPVCQSKLAVWNPSLVAWKYPGPALFHVVNSLLSPFFQCSKQKSKLPKNLLLHVMVIASLCVSPHCRISLFFLICIPCPWKAGRTHCFFKYRPDSAWHWALVNGFGVKTETTKSCNKNVGGCLTLAALPAPPGCLATS